MQWPIANFRRPAGKWFAMIVGLVLLTMVTWSDWITGPNLDFSLFYLIPVCFVAWYAGQKFGYLMAIVSAAAWLCADRLTGAKPATPLVVYWNLLTRVSFFAGSVLLLEGWKSAGKKLSVMVEQRTSALRRLAAQLSAAEEAERRKLAYDMHDALSQSLSLIKMNVDESQAETTDRPTLHNRLGDCGSMIDKVIRQTRTLMFDLYPAMLDDLGLVPTLQWYAREFGGRTSVEIVVSEQGSRLPLPTAFTNYLFRASKELLGNAVRHGHAKEVIVSVHWEPDRIRLVLDDDGIGFDVDEVRSRQPLRGLGLPGIEERITSMGGRLDLESKSGQGSRIILEVPIPEIIESENGDDVARIVG